MKNIDDLNLEPETFPFHVGGEEIGHPPKLRSKFHFQLSCWSVYDLVRGYVQFRNMVYSFVYSNKAYNKQDKTKLTIKK